MKKYKLLIIIILLAIAVIFTPTKTYADGDKNSCSGPKVICEYGGVGRGALGLAGHYNVDQKQIVNGGAKCKPDDLCFSGRGMFIYLLRYDPKTKTETVVGKPILYHTDTFLNKQIVVVTSAEEAPIDPEDSRYSTLINWGSSFFGRVGLGIGSYLGFGPGYAVLPTPNNSCNASLTPPGQAVRYKSQEMIEYGGKGTGKITYRINNQTFAESQVNFVSVSSSILNTSSEENLQALSDYIINQIKLLAGKDLPTLNSKFETNIQVADLDNYYIAIEFASRVGESKEQATKLPSNNTAVDKTTAILYSPPGGIKYEWECNTWNAAERLAAVLFPTISATEPTSGCDDLYDTSWVYQRDATTKICGYGPSCRAINGLNCQLGNKVSDNCYCICEPIYEEGESCSDDRSNPDCKKVLTLRTKHKWTKTGCNSISISFDKELYIDTYSGKSTVMNARTAGSTKLISEIFTPIESNECGVGINCTMEIYQSREGATKSEFTEHFIGPDLERALVGKKSSTRDESKNTYKYEFGNSQSYVQQGNTKYANGVSYWWLITVMEASSEHKCLESEGGPCKENDLSCAEAYCQAAIGNESGTDIYDKKRDCIINQCKVKEPENPCKSTKYNNDYLRLLNNTSCNTTTKQYSCGNPDSEENLPYDKNGPVTNKSYPTLWCYTDASDTNISLRSFINVSCAESQLVSFVDVSKQRLTTGVGIEYNAGIKGQKVCNVWFDMDRWQLEYASYGEKERLCLPGDEIDEYKRCPENDEKGPLARDVLNEILKHYNEMAEYGKDIKYKDGSIREKDKIYDTIASIMSAEERTNALITWEDLDYQLEDLSTGATTKISEALNNKGLASGDYILQKNIDNNPEVSTLKSLNTEITKGKTFARTNATEVTAKTFKTVSETEVHYAFDKYCVSQDGKGTITKNDGVCYTIKDKNGSPKEIRGQRLYYTSLKSLGNIEKYKFSIDKTVAKVATVKPTIPSDGLEYSHICQDREYNDSCEVSLEEDDPPCKEEDCPPDIIQETKGCSIVVKSNNGIKDGIYFGNVEISLMQEFSLIDDSIDAIKIQVNDTTYDQSKVTVSIESSDPITKKYEIVGTITTKNGKKVECDDEVTIAQQRNNCVIEVKDNSDPQDIIYKVSGVGSIPEIFTSRDETRVKASLADGEYLFRIKRSEVEKGIVIFAVTSNGSVKCYKSFPDSDPPCEDCPPGDDPDSVNCYEWNKNFDKTRAEVAGYCVNWEKDVTKFNGKEDCTNKCWKSNCPIVYSCDEKGIEPVRQYCSTKYGANTKEESQCISRCTQFSCDTGDYLYRPIDIEDPFPRSSKSAFNEGTRKIGGNWVGFERYITDDYEDSSTLTGPNANISVEYIVDLSLDDIRSIRNSTAKEKVGENNGYTDYQETKWTDEGTGNQYITDYKSSFIHSQYKRLFQQGINSNGQYYNATGNIE